MAAFRSVRFLASVNSYFRASNCSFLQRISPLNCVQERSFVKDRPEIPKAPTTPFVKFITENRNDILNNNPKLKTVEVTKIASGMWKNLDESDKQKYRNQYKEELRSFQENTDPELLKARTDLIREKRNKLKKRRARLAHREELRELKKPKSPMKPFFMFVENRPKSDSTSNHLDHIRAVAAEWNSLSPEQKQPYFDKSAQLRREYEELLLDWEDRMVQDGNLKLVRKSTLDKVGIRLDKPKARKKKAAKRKPAKKATSAAKKKKTSAKKTKSAAKTTAKKSTADNESS
ncbi:transcription factor A, mitochondrial-like [Tubulanus polymorphus]|uniref:transcription factor A, mitochondrial-like n=1 Tax=Tubulanus polymorphus TaxID=672921 RepID=UPI003DA3A8DE